jgi:hypothetical protein
MKKLLSGFFIFLIASLLLLVKSSPQNKAYADPADHIVISEVQITGGTPDDEFVELYNPTGNDVLLDGWRLTRKNSSGTEANLVASLSGTISAHGYFLIGHGTGYDGAVALNQDYSAASNALTNDFIVLLYSDASVTLVDKVGMEDATDFETAVFPNNPAANGSIERKAKSNSTTESMGSGGDDELLGNSEDTDNNANDFVLRETSGPQNSESPTETLAEETPTPTPTPTDEPTATPTPTDEPTATPTPTTEPTNTPAPTPPPSNIIAVFPLSRHICVLRKTYMGFMMIPKLTCYPLSSL